MRFMVMIKANAETEAGVLPTTEEIEAMTRYNEELAKAGVMLAGEGLHPSSAGAKVQIDGDSRTVIDGPFTEAKELVAGFWIIQTKSLEEAVEWVKRVPNPTGVRGEIEIRRVFDTEDFGDVMTPELVERENALRAQTEGR